MKAGVVSIGQGLATHPYLWLYGLFLLVNVGLSVGHATIHDSAMLARWPMLGLVAGVGLLFAGWNGLGAGSAPRWILATLVALALASAFFSVDRWYTIQRAGSITLLYVASFVGLYAYAQRADRARALTDLFWVIGGLLAMGGFVFRLEELSEGSAPARFTGLHDRATGAGTYAALFLPIALGAVHARLRGVARGVGWFVVLALAAQLVMTGARTALVISFVVGLVLAWLYFGIRSWAGVGALTIVAGIVVLVTPGASAWLAEKSERLTRVESIATFTGRWDRWEFGVEQFRKRPVIGHGFGASRLLAGLEDPARFKLQPGETFTLHSDQIETLCDLGVVGGALFALFWLSIFALGLRLLFRPRSERRSRALAYLGAGAYLFVDTFMHGGFFAAGGGVAAFAWSLLAAGCAEGQLARTPEPPPEDSRRPTQLRVVSPALSIHRSRLKTAKRRLPRVANLPQKRCQEPF